MVTKVVPGLLIATPDPAQAAREAAARMSKTIREAIRDHGVAHIALSGGTSPFDAYRLLAAESFDWNKIHVWFVDERCVPPDSDRSNFANAKKALIDVARVPESNVHRMRGEASDPAIAAADYEADLRENIKNKLSGLPALDLVVLGIGDDGHTASLFPGEPTLHISDKLATAVPAKGSREARITLTAPVLENARASVILVLGKAKHPALENVWAANGDANETPARIIRSFRGSITWVIDRAAGGMG
jgi:6-phosphogluconolactonase